jgi:hypothetical protein
VIVRPLRRPELPPQHALADIPAGETSEQVTSDGANQISKPDLAGGVSAA